MADTTMRKVLETAINEFEAEIATIKDVLRDFPAEDLDRGMDDSDLSDAIKWVLKRTPRDEMLSGSAWWGFAANCLLDNPRLVEGFSKRRKRR